MKTFHQLKKRLAKAGNGNPHRSVEELAAHVIGCRPLDVHFRELSAVQTTDLDALIARAESGEPIQYVIGSVDFRGISVLCDRRALIPRPETELLVDEVLRAVGQSRSPFSQIADVCTGTGCVGLALAQELPLAEVTAIDLSTEALALAQENAIRLGLSARFQTVECDLLEGYAERSFDWVVSNPPYIVSAICRNLDASVRDYEPHLALDGGEDGLDLIRPLVVQAARVLKPGGGLFIEIGYDQGTAVSQCLVAAGFEQVRVIPDYAGLDRIVSGSVKQS